MGKAVGVLSIVFSLFICSSVVLGASGFMYGESFEGGCFLSNDDLSYGNVSSLNVTIPLFRVHYNDFHAGWGSHIGDVDNNVFDYTLYCNNFLNVTPDYDGDSKNVVYTGTYIENSPDKDQPYGSHVFPFSVDNESLYQELDTLSADGLYLSGPSGDLGSLDNTALLDYVKENTYKGDCPDAWECIAKVSPYNNRGYEFSNSHVWSCNVSFDTDMYSICYKPIYRTNCNATAVLADEERTCDWPGWAYVPRQELPSGEFLYEWRYCSFGKDDVQYPAYDPDNASDSHEIGHCCPSGTYYDEESNQCFDARDAVCGFGSGEECGVDEDDFFSFEYFNDPGCFDDFWVTRDDWPLGRTSCCKDVEGYGGVKGNFRCYVKITST